MLFILGIVLLAVGLLIIVLNLLEFTKGINIGIVCLIIGFVSFLAAMPLSRTGIVEIKYTTQYNITSLETTRNLGGTFILGSGYFQQEPVYYVYREVSEGLYHLEFIEASFCDIYETNNTLPCYQKGKPVWKPCSWWIAPPSFGWGEQTNNATNRLVIPVGSIIKEYNPNLS